MGKRANEMPVAYYYYYYYVPAYLSSSLSLSYTHSRGSIPELVIKPFYY